MYQGGESLDKQQLIREKILYQYYTQSEIFEFMNSKKGTDLNNYEYDELNQVLEEFLVIKRQEKQLYLQENILEQNFNAQDFLQFLQSQKIDGGNIDNWNIEDLKDAVTQFSLEYAPVETDEEETQEEQQIRISKQQDILTQSICKISNGEASLNIVEDFDSNASQFRESWSVFKQKITDQQNENQLEQISEEANESDVSAITQFQEQQESEQKQMQQQQQQQSQQKPKVSFKESQQEQYQQDRLSSIRKRKEICKEEFEMVFGPHMIKQQFLQKQEHCVREKSELPQKNKLKVQVTNFERISGGFLGLTDRYVLYELTTEPYNYKVKRRINDFLILRKSLIKLFPGKLIPPLDTNVNESTDFDVYKRMQNLTTFTNNLKISEEIWSNAVTQVFFRNQNEWEPVSQKVRDQNAPKKAVSSMTGQHNIRISKQNYIYNKEVQVFVEKIKLEYQDLSVLTDQVSGSIKKLSQDLAKINHSHQNLLMQLTNFSMQLTQMLPGSEELEDILSNNKFLENTLKNMSNIMQSWARSTQQQGTLMDAMENLYRYSYLNLNNTKDLISGYNNAQQQFFTHHQNIEKQAKSNPQIYNSPKVIGERVDLETNLGYWSQQTYVEMQEMLNQQGEQYISFFNYLARFETLRVNELLKHWGRSIEEYFENPFPQPRTQNFDHLMQTMTKTYSIKKK